MARNLGSLPQRDNEGGPTYRPALEIKSLPFDNDDKFVAQYWGSRGNEEDILELNGNPGSFCAMDMVDKELWINSESVGNYLGYRMAGGIIQVGQDCSIGNFTGAFMKGGVIRIYGDVGDFLGYNMMGGYIEVIGSVGHNAGYGATGGKIRVIGTCARGANMDVVEIIPPSE